MATCDGETRLITFADLPLGPLLRASLRAWEAREVVWGQDGGLFETSYGSGTFLGVVRNARNCEGFEWGEGFAISSAGVFGFVRCLLVLTGAS